MMQPPIARRQPRTTTMHGMELIDDYYWLRERSNPEVLEYIEAENAYAAAMLRSTDELQQQLYDELRGRIKETDEAVPVWRDGYFYGTRTEAGQQYPIYYRKQGSLDAPEEVLLDQNALAEGHTYCRIGAFKVSPDHRLLAYSVDTSGAEAYTLYIKDLETGALLADQVPNVYYGVEWAEDNLHIFYNVIDAAMRPYKLFRHRVGSDPDADVQVYHEPDESFFVWIVKSNSRRYLLLTLRSTTTNEIHYLEADRPTDDFRIVAPREHEVEYSVEHHGERFLIVTNLEAKNFKLVEAPVTSPSREHWRDLIPHRPEVMLDDVEPFRDFLAIHERSGGLQRITIVEPDGSNPRQVAFPEPVYAYRLGPNEEFNSDLLRFSYSSLVTPNSVIDYNMRTGAWDIKKQDEIPSGYDPSQYQSERLFATAADGTQVPISLVYRKGIARDGANPMLLYGYGSYGLSSDPTFSASRLSLIDRGFIYAIAHIRGGSELGREWYEAGKLQNKKNTFTDFVACAEHLIAAGYTSSERLAIMGGSAGGLLIGAVVNMRPDLFKAAIAKVAFMDVINTMSDPTLPLTVIEYEQWGNPSDRTAFDYMRSYSPYDNIEAKAYPNLLLTAGLNDPRVSYWEPAKWVARLRTLKTNDNLLLLKTNTEAGHGGASGRYDYLKEVAFDYAFLLYVLGMTE